MLHSTAVYPRPCCRLGSNRRVGRDRPVTKRTCLLFPLDGAIIQVEGNINARNYSDSGQALSAERAKAVAKYFIACGIDPNRLITVGNGNTKMVADPGSADAYLNRRTDVFFKIIEE